MYVHVCPFHFTDAAVAVLEEVAQRMHNRKKRFENSRPHRCAVGMGIGFFGILLVASIVLGNNPVLIFFSAHSMGPFVLVAMGLMGVAFLIAWLVLVFNIRHVNGIGSHIEAIRIRLGYNCMLAEAGSDYHIVN